MMTYIYVRGREGVNYHVKLINNDHKEYSNFRNKFGFF